MISSPINIILVMFLVVVVCGYAALMQSPDALEVLARKMRARSRAIRASREAWAATYESSIEDDLRLDTERAEFNAMVER